MKLKFAVHTLHLRRAIPSATSGNLADQERLYVQMELDDGTLGYGEAAPHPIFGPSIGKLKHQVKRWLNQRDVPPDWADRQQWESAPLCLQIAGIDASARQRREPAWQYLGLAKPPPSIRTVLTFGGMPDEIRRDLQREAPAAVKLKLLGQAEDWNRITAMLDCFSGPFALDINTAWRTWGEAAANLKRLQKMLPPDAQVLWIEQPCLPQEMHKPLPTDYSVLADEAVEHSAFQWEHYDGIVIKPAASAPGGIPKIRGFARCMDLAREAAAREKAMILGCHLQSSLLSSASLHLGGALRDSWCDLDSVILVKDDPFFPPISAEPLTGTIATSLTPGFGVDPAGISWE